MEGKKRCRRERKRRRMEKNSFDQSLKPITRRKLLTRGLSLCLSLPFSLSLLCLQPLSLPLLCLLTPHTLLFPLFLFILCAYFCFALCLLFEHPFSRHLIHIFFYFMLSGPVSTVPSTTIMYSGEFTGKQSF